MLKNRLFRLIVSSFFGALLLAGCSSAPVSQYNLNTPAFDLFDYFAHPVRGWGMVLDRRGTMTRSFVVDIDGRLDESGRLVLDEAFLWNDGERSRRIWTITRNTDGTFSGTAADVIGTARGQSAGNALSWNYDLDLAVDGRHWTIAFDDWMFLQPDGVLLNKATMTKFGFRLGEVIISFAQTDKPVESKP